MQKAKVLLIAFLIYNLKAWTKIWQCFMEVSQLPDTASHVMVSSSRITQKLEIAYCMCLGFWTLGFWPDAAEKLLLRWDKLSFGLARFLSSLRSLDWNTIISGAVFRRLGLSVVTDLDTKEYYGGAGVSGCGRDERRMSVPHQRLGRVNEEGWVSRWENGGVRT